GPSSNLNADLAFVWQDTRSSLAYLYIFDSAGEEQRMPSMFRRFLANDPRLLTGIGTRERNRISVDGSRIGTILYGPYILLCPGQYEARVTFDPAIMPMGSATLDVSVDTGRTVLATRTLAADRLQEEGMSASLKFSSGDVMRRTEI